MIPVGRSVIVPANGALPNIVLSPSAIRRVHGRSRRERFDVLHMHEPMTPVICTAALSWARCPVVATFHASGQLAWIGRQAVWGFLMDRIDHRIAVSEAARESADRWYPGDYELIRTGRYPAERRPFRAREPDRLRGQADPRKGMPVLLFAPGPGSASAPGRSCASSEPTR